MSDFNLAVGRVQLLPKLCIFAFCLHKDISDPLGCSLGAYPAFLAFSPVPEGSPHTPSVQRSRIPMSKSLGCLQQNGDTWQ